MNPLMTLEAFKTNWPQCKHKIALIEVKIGGQLGYRTNWKKIRHGNNVLLKYKKLSETKIFTCLKRPIPNPVVPSNNYG
jgi:hypothetical protein